ncbi:hypothetical protein L9F63_001507, partial [Diploptera punctata]
KNNNNNSKNNNNNIKNNNNNSKNNNNNIIKCACPINSVLNYHVIINTTVCVLYHRSTILTRNKLYK